MDTEEARPGGVGAGREGLGGPSGESLPGNPDSFTPHGCVESELVWLLLSGEAPPPDTAGWRAMLHMVEALTQRKLAAIRPILARSEMDACIPNRYAERYLDYEVPAWAKSGNEMLARRREAAA